MPGLDAPPLLTGAGADATQSWIVDVPSRRSSCGMVARARARCAVGWVVAAFGALHAHAAGPPAGSALVIRNAEIYDGRGGAPYRGEIAVTGDRIVAIGAMVSAAPGARVINARGLAVAPGFINVLSWAPDSLIVDGRGVSDIKQGVTLEIFGEGFSYGPLSKENRSEMLKRQGDIRYPITWTTLAEFLDFLVAKGVSPNVASFVGAATVRVHEIGFANRPPTPDELARMQRLVRAAMRDGALGVGSALIYAPGSYAATDELIALASAAGESGGGYTSHIRSEGDRFLEGVDELIAIARAAGVHGEVHHLKAGGESNWPKMTAAIVRIDAARRAGLPITANMYSYTAGATGLDAAMPTWVQEGGLDAWVERLKDPAKRVRVRDAMRAPGADWENLYFAAGSPDRVLLIGFKSPALKPYTGKTLAEVAKLRGTSPEDTAIDLVIEDGSRVDTAYFLMSEENVRLGLSQPWVSICSDEGAYSPQDVFLKSNNHPRAYGSFARFLGKYVRDEKVATLPDAIRRLTRLPAENWKLRDRGCLDPGCHADIVIFDPATISDHATFDDPRRAATGVRDVFVNGVQVLRDGEHTGALPGQVVRGPGWVGWAQAEPPLLPR
jgi:N-acyl-D-amino-acid deacylase